MSKYDTNLAAEFYVLSCLHRLGISANLTLGNRKGVDIVVTRQAGEAVTVEVKGIAKRYDWPADNLVTLDPQRHFVVLVSFEGKIDDPTMPAPRVWVFPYPQIEPVKRFYKTRTNVTRAAIEAGAGRFENAWHLIEGSATPQGGSGPAASVP